MDRLSETLEVVSQERVMINAIQGDRVEKWVRMTIRNGERERGIAVSEGAR